MEVVVGGSGDQHTFIEKELSFGDIYAGLLTVKAIWIRNASEDTTVSVTLTATRQPAAAGIDDEEDDDLGDEVAFESVSSSSERTRDADAAALDADTNASAAMTTSSSAAATTTTTAVNNHAAAYDGSAGGIIKRRKGAFLPKSGPPSSPFLSYIAAKNPRAALRKLTATIADLKRRGHALAHLIDPDVGDERDTPAGPTEDGAAAAEPPAAASAAAPSSSSSSSSRALVFDAADPRYVRRHQDTGFRLAAEAAPEPVPPARSSSEYSGAAHVRPRDFRGSFEWSEDAYDAPYPAYADAYDYGDEDDEYALHHHR